MIPANISACYIRSGNSSNKIFDFDFIIDKPSDLIVVKWDVLSDKRTNLIYNKDYTINEFSNPGGSYITYPINKSELLKEHEKLFLISAREIKQQYLFSSSGEFDMHTFEKALDYIVTLIKQIDYTLSRTVKIPYGMENEYINEFLQIFLEKVNEAKKFSEEISEFEKEVVKIKSIIEESSEAIKFGAKWVYFAQNDWGKENNNNYYLSIDEKSVVFDIYKKCENGREKIFNCDIFTTDNGVKITSPEAFEGYAVVAANTIGEYVFEVNTPQSEWVIEHNLGKYPSVTLVDNDGNIFYGNVQYVDLNTIKVTFKKVISGKAYLN